MELLLLWGKTSPSGAVHPLPCHLLDVASVAAVMWRDVLGAGARQQVARVFGVDEDTAGRWVAFLAGLHDLGKCSPAFQSRDQRAAAWLAPLNLPQGTPNSQAPHGSVTACTLPAYLESEFGVPGGVAKRLATVVGGHHGVFPRSDDLDRLRRRSVGTGGWDSLRRDLVRLLASLLDVREIDVPQGIDTATSMLVAGLVSVADWIGSDEDRFPLAVSDPAQATAIDLTAYAADAADRAAEAIALLRWAGWSPDPGPRTFSDLFDLPAPNRLQQAAIDVAARIDPTRPGLVIVEAPMGEGKTEAALYYTDAWAGDQRRGAYIALPTQATSDQMFGRVRRFLSRRYSEGIVNLQLLHGHAALSAEFNLLRRQGDALLMPVEQDDDEDADAEGQVIAAGWFTYRKRGLLAPFGVGTIDQALLAALQTKHVFVRLFGLAGKTVVVDEVHAYDTYMTALLERLLEWLAALGSPVILLSATLPRTRRERLVAAYRRGLGLPAVNSGEDVAYPRITWLTPDDAGSRHVPMDPRVGRCVHIDWLADDIPDQAGAPFELGERLQAALAGGGCAAVICNTVGRAQAVYRALKRYFPEVADDGAPELDLLHARFTFDERQRREQRALLRFGKPGRTVTLEEGEREVHRPYRAVLVATQIIEQSLDLDFDLMVSDLAPVDLVLQRTGRLHRHDRGEKRPPDLRRPQLWLIRPEEHDGVPRFDRGSAAVYDEHVLLRSWLALKDLAVLQSPDAIEPLVEAVYDDRPCPADASAALREGWTKTRDALDATMRSDIEEAQMRWLKRPHSGGFFWEMTTDAREEDAPDFHVAHQALTRLAEPSVPLVCLSRAGDGAVLDAEGQEQVDLNAKPSLEDAASLLRRSVTVSDRRVVAELLQTDVPPGWRRSALLRHHRVVLLDERGQAIVGRYRITLDAEIGLCIERREEEE